MNILGKNKDDDISLDEFLTSFLKHVHATDENSEMQAKECIHLCAINFWKKAEVKVERHIFEDNFRRDCTTENCYIL